MNQIITLRRKLSDGLLEGSALQVYVPRRRGARHFEDTFSQALYLSKSLPDYGQQFAWDSAPAVAALVPAGAQVLTCPPASRARRAAGFYFARELTVAVAEGLTGDGDGRAVTVARPLRWAQEQIAGAGAAKQIMHQGGHGRKLGRRVECLEDLTGAEVVIIDDLWTSGATAAVTAEALFQVGAAAVFVVTLAATERTEARPAEERERLRWRAEARRG